MLKGRSGNPAPGLRPGAGFPSLVIDRTNPAQEEHAMLRTPGGPPATFPLMIGPDLLTEHAPEHILYAIRKLRP